MTVTPHTAAAIAQVVLYAPMAPITTYLLIRNWRWRPRTAWYPSAAFSASERPLQQRIVLYMANT